MKYETKIDGGQGGETEIEADSVEEALVEAVEWAKEGDWPDDGCTISVSVENTNDEDDGNCNSIEVDIPSKEEKFDEKLIEDGEVIAQDISEFATEQIVVMDYEAYHMHPNGGSRGAYDRMCGDGVWRDSPINPTRRIDRTEARKLMLDWGYDPVEVARLTKEIED